MHTNGETAKVPLLKKFFHLAFTHAAIWIRYAFKNKLTLVSKLSRFKNATIFILQEGDKESIIYQSKQSFVERSWNSLLVAKLKLFYVTLSYPLQD